MRAKVKVWGRLKPREAAECLCFGLKVPALMIRGLRSHVTSCVPNVHNPVCGFVTVTRPFLISAAGLSNAGGSNGTRQRRRCV